MKKVVYIVILMTGAFFTNALFAAEGSEEVTEKVAPNETEEALVWYTNLTEAQAESKKTDKPIFGFFTGSDWCGWCIRLQNNVFKKPAFIEWAKDNVILLELDFPKRKQLPAEIAQQNNGLRQAFGVRGYPTIWIFTADLIDGGARTSLNAIGKLGYPSGSVPGKEEVTFIERANTILAQNK